MVNGGSDVATGDEQPVELTADNDADIIADSGGGSLGISGGKATGLNASIGAALATNNLGTSGDPDSTEASIDGATVASDGAVDVTADAGHNKSHSIRALAIGIAGSIAVGSGAGVALAGAGSSATNTINREVAATISDNSQVSSANSGAVDVAATDDSDIQAGAGAGALAIAGGSGGGVSVAVGASISANEVTNTVLADIDGGTVDSAGGVQVTATSSTTIYAVAAAGVISGSRGGADLAASGAGAGTYNTVDNSVEALINGGSSVTTGNDGGVIVTALANDSITADSGGGSLSVSYNQGGGGSVSIGAAVAENNIGTGDDPDNVIASIDDSTINSSGIVYVHAVGGTDDSSFSSLSSSTTTFDASSDVDTANSIIDVGSNSSYSAGEEVLYEDGGNGDADVGGLTDDAAYYVILVPNSSSEIQLADSYDDALAGDYITLTSAGTGTQTLQQVNSPVSTFDSGNTQPYCTDINLGSNPGYTTGEEIVYNNGSGTSIGGLTNGQVYYAVVNSSTPDILELADSYANAIAGTVIKMTTAGTGTAQNFSPVITNSNTFDGDADVSTEDAASNPDTIDFGYNDGFTNGEAVVYNDGGGTAIGNLTSGQVYYVIVVNSTTIELADTNSDATNGYYLYLSTAGAGTSQHFDTISSNSSTFNGANILGSTLYLGYDDGFSTGQEVVYNDGNGVPIDGLVNNQAYYVIVVDSQDIQLASSQSNADNGTYLTLTFTGVAAQEKTVALAVGVAGDIAASQGAAVSLAGAGSGATNAVYQDITATIANNSTVTTANDGDVTVQAEDKTDDRCGAGEGVLGIAGAQGAGVAISIGVAVTVNAINVDTTAAIEDARVVAAGSVDVSSASYAKIHDVTVAGGIDVVGAGGGGVAIDGAGALAFNTVTDTILAYINDGSNVTSADDDDVSVAATDAATIFADAGGVSIAVAVASTFSASVAIGAAYATNTVTDTTKAYIEDGDVVSASDVNVNAVSTSNITGHAFGVALAADASATGGSGAGSGAITEDTITDTIIAFIASDSIVTAAATGADAINVTASDGSSVTANDGAGSLAFTVAAGGSLAAGDVTATNNINNTVDAYIGSTPGTNEGFDTVVANANTFNGASNVTVTNDLIDLGFDPGFTTGEQVVYSNGGGSDIGGLRSGTVYYVILDAANSDEIELATSAANASGGIAITLTTPGSGTSQSFSPVATGADTFDAAADVTVSGDYIDLGFNPGFTTGAEVVYDNGGGTSIGGLTSGAVYYVILVSGSSTRIELASSYANATAATPTPITLTSPGSGTSQTLSTVTTSAETFDASLSTLVTDPGNVASDSVEGVVPGVDSDDYGGGDYGFVDVGYVTGFTTGEELVYDDGGGTAIGGLTSGTVYYAIVNSSYPSRLQLDDSYADAISANPTPVTITGAGVGSNQHFDVVNAATQTFDGSQSSSNLQNVIDFGYDHGFTNGEEVVYNDDGGTHIGGLTSGHTYYAILNDATPTLLELSKTDGGSAINLTSLGSGTQTLERRLHQHRVLRRQRRRVDRGQHHHLLVESWVYDRRGARLRKWRRHQHRRANFGPGLLWHC